jgi:hypothetical protein
VRVPLLGFIAILPASVALANDTAQADVRQLAPGRYEITMNLPTAVDERVAQQLLQPVATHLCGSEPATFGKYRFNSTTPLPTTDTPAPPPAPANMLFVQEVQCGGPTAVRPGTPAPKTPPTPGDEALVRQQTLDYLMAKDNGDYDAALALVTEGTGEMLRNVEARAQRTGFIAKSGTPTEREVIRLTWYDDPANAPTLGRYVAADYRARFASGAFYCGYVAWLLQPDGTYRIIREEEGQMLDEIARRIPPDQMAATRRQMGCRD